MSVNTVIFDSALDLVLNPGERVIYKCGNVRLSLESGGGYPGMGGSYECSAGDLYLTNHRVAYIVNPSMQHFKGFQVALANMHDVKLNRAMFGSNDVRACVQPVPGHGLVGNVASLCLTFRTGGAPEFHTFYLFAMQSDDTASRADPGEPLPEYTAAPRESDTVVLPATPKDE